MKEYKIDPYYPAYAIYRSGQVVNINSKRTLKPEKTKNGYLRIALCAKGTTKRFLLHRLIALQFIDNPANKPCINHKNGDKLNNDISNLEWCTHSENNYHSVNELKRYHPKGEGRWNTVYTDAQIKEMKDRRSSGDSCRSIARDLGCSHQHVSDVTLGKRRL
jgi:hypothetical protein